MRGILQSRAVVSSPLTALNGGQYVRTVNVGKTIGNASINQGGGPTSWMKIFTDGRFIKSYIQLAKYTHCL